MRFPPRNRRLPLRAVAAALGMLAACSSLTSPAMRASLTAAADRTSYSLADEDVPVISLRHEGGPSVIINACREAPAAILERRDTAGWVEETKRGLICPGIYTMDTDTIGPGDVRSFPLAAYRPGTYRVRVLIGPDYAAPQRTVLTREFEVQ